MWHGTRAGLCERRCHNQRTVKQYKYTVKEHKQRDDSGRPTKVLSIRHLCR